MVTICVSKPTLCVLEIMTPQRTNFVLSADIPHCETDVFVLNGLHIKTYMEKYKIKITLKLWHIKHVAVSLSLLKKIFIYLFLPIVGIVVTTSPSLSLYNIVVFPAASRPTMRILISLLPNIANRLENIFPIAAGDGNLWWWKGKQYKVWIWLEDGLA